MFASPLRDLYARVWPWLSVTIDLSLLFTLPSAFTSAFELNPAWPLELLRSTLERLSPAAVATGGKV